MKETIYDVAFSLKEAQPQFRRERIPVVARVLGNFDGISNTYWFIMGSMNRNKWSFPGIKFTARLYPGILLLLPKY